MRVVIDHFGYGKEENFGPVLSKERRCCCHSTKRGKKDQHMIMRCHKGAYWANARRVVKRDSYGHRSLKEILVLREENILTCTLSGKLLIIFFMLTGSRETYA